MGLLIRHENDNIETIKVGKIAKRIASGLASGIGEAGSSFGRAGRRAGGAVLGSASSFKRVGKSIVSSDAAKQFGKSWNGLSKTTRRVLVGGAVTATTVGIYAGVHDMTFEDAASELARKTIRTGADVAKEVGTAGVDVIKVVGTAGAKATGSVFKELLDALGLSFMWLYIIAGGIGLLALIALYIRYI